MPASRGYPVRLYLLNLLCASVALEKKMERTSYLAIPEEEDREEAGDKVITALHRAADDFIRRVLQHPETLKGEFSDDLGVLIWSHPVVKGGILCQLRQAWDSRTISVRVEGLGDRAIAVPYEAQQSALYTLVRQLPQDHEGVQSEEY